MVSTKFEANTRTISLTAVAKFEDFFEFDPDPTFVQFTTDINKNISKHNFMTVHIKLTYLNRVDR